MGFRFIDFAVHGVNLIYLVLDFPVCAIPIRLHHLWVSYVYGAIYVIFSVIYWAAGGKGWNPNGSDSEPNWIYPILDYGGNPGLAVGSILGILVALLLIHALWLGLYKLKQKAWSKHKIRQHEQNLKAANSFSASSEGVWTSEKDYRDSGHVNQGADVCVV